MITLALTDPPALTSLKKVFPHCPVHSSSRVEVGFCPTAHMVAAAPATGSLPPSALLPPGRLHCFGGTISVCYSLRNPMGPRTERAVKCTSPSRQRNDLVCPAKQHRCQAAPAHTSRRFVLRTHGPALFKQPAKTSETGFGKYLMSA